VEELCHKGGGEERNGSQSEEGESPSHLKEEKKPTKSRLSRKSRAGKKIVGESTKKKRRYAGNERYCEG